MRMKLFSAVLLSSALLLACGEEEAAADTEGCEHLQEGPASAISASASVTDAPAVSNDHRRYDIALTDVTGGKGGSVSFAAAEAADYYFFLGASVPLDVKNFSGAILSPVESTQSSNLCTEIKGRHRVPLTVGTYTLTFGPTTLTSVSLVIEEAEGELNY